MEKILGLRHRADGIFGYQLKNGAYRAIVQAPKGEISNIKIQWDDPYNWINKIWVCRNIDNSYKIESDSTYDYFSFEIDSREKRFKYFFVFDYKNKKYAYGEFGLIIFQELEKFNYHGFSFTWNYSSIGKYVSPPNWWNKTNWYQIFPDRFASDKENLKDKNEDNNKTIGGNIKGIINKLKYIKELGFNGIYLNPIFKATSYHKYDTEDYFQIDPDFGTMEDFENLIKEAKKKKIKIMLDGVFNHCGYNFKYWLDVVKNKNNSKYKDWFVIWDIEQVGLPEKFKDTNFHISGSQKSFSTFGNTPTMPRFNWNNKEVRKYIKKIITFWSKKGIDAWRMDVADEVSFEMWREIRKTFKDINSKGVILGEVWYDSMIFMHGDQFDSTMNYPFRSNAIDFFVKKTKSIQEFVEDFNMYKYRYSEVLNKGLFNLIGSHDTKRIFDICNKDKIKTKFMLSWLILSSGVISFYYGDEINLIGVNDDMFREPFDWDFDRLDETYLFVKKLLIFRNENINIIKSDSIIKHKNNKLIIEFTNNFKIIFDLDKKEIKLFNKTLSLL